MQVRHFEEGVYESEGVLRLFDPSANSNLDFDLHFLRIFLRPCSSPLTKGRLQGPISSGLPERAELAEGQHPPPNWQQRLGNVSLSTFMGAG